MKSKIAFIILLVTMTLGVSSCGTTHSGGAHSLNAYGSVKPNIVNYDEVTMTLDPVGVEYTIDVSTSEGRMKLANLTLQEAEELALVEAIMKNRCVTMFQPQYTHLKRGKKILRVTVYGIPARYKVKE